LKLAGAMLEEDIEFAGKAMSKVDLLDMLGRDAD